MFCRFNLVLFNLILSDKSSGTFESRFVMDKLSLSSDGVWREQVRTVLLVKNERLGLTRAQQSAYGRLVAKAIATIGLTGCHSFLPVIGSKRRSTSVGVTLSDIFSRNFPTVVQLSVDSGSSPGMSCQFFEESHHHFDLDNTTI